MQGLVHSLASLAESSSGLASIVQGDRQKVNPYPVAALVATLAGILTRNLLATIAICLVSFFALQMMLG
jgi:branched-subunit amino acid transport protein